MPLTELSAISPIDGRYNQQIEKLSEYFSEYSWIKNRVKIEIEYFIHLSEIPIPQLKNLSKKTIQNLRNLYIQFNITEAQQIKNIEKDTNHDVKAVEYYLKKCFTKLGLDECKEYIHFGLTSQDVNNPVYSLLFKEFLEKEYLPKIQTLAIKLRVLVQLWKKNPMLAFTHGQPASPTTMGKEIMVFCDRLSGQLRLLETIPHYTKFGGASGNLNAHYLAFPQINWDKFSDNFIKNLGLIRNKYTTQIEPYDNLCAFFDNLKRINSILIDLCRDLWQYISMEYFTLKIVKKEVGSSAMPHKVNPIDFENAEGNFLYSNAIFEFLSTKLPVSRLQRDLTDSTVMRNMGVPLAHTYIAVNSILKGIGKLELNEEKLKKDLENNQMVIAEGIQTILRREGFAGAYEALKVLVRTKEKVTARQLWDFIDSLKISTTIKKELKQITPFNYTGNSKIIR